MFNISSVCIHTRWNVLFMDRLLSESMMVVGIYKSFEHTIFVLTFVEILRIHPIQWGACTFLDKFTPDINKVCCNMAILSQEINLDFNLRCKLIILGWVTVVVKFLLLVAQVAQVAKIHIAV